VDGLERARALATALARVARALATALARVARALATALARVARALATALARVARALATALVACRGVAEEELREHLTRVAIRRATIRRRSCVRI
jgi:hypothetical protein